MREMVGQTDIQYARGTHIDIDRKTKIHRDTCICITVYTQRPRYKYSIRKETRKKVHMQCTKNSFIQKWRRSFIGEGIRGACFFLAERLYMYRACFNFAEMLRCVEGANKGTGKFGTWS